MTTFSGATKPTSTDQDEHLTLSGVGVKRVLSAGYDGTDIHDIATDTNGVLKIASGFNIPVFDNVTQTQATLTDTWVFKVGVTTKATITITYTDATKTVISTVVKS